MGWPSKVGGFSSFGLGSVCHPFWAVSVRDVAEAALGGAGRSWWRVWRRHTVNQRDEAVDELLVHAALWHTLDAIGVMDLARDSGVPVLFSGARQCVHVHHDLGNVRGALDAGFGIDDEDVVVRWDNQVRLAGEGGDAALEPEGVLTLDADVVAAFLELAAGVAQQRGVVDLPLGEVEIGGRAFPALVMGSEPRGPFAGAFAGEELGEPGRPDVGEGALSGGHVGLSALVVGDALQFIGACVTAAMG